MASIRAMDSGRWQAVVRRRGLKAVFRTFNTKTDATKWARIMESEIERGLWHDTTKAETTTLADAIHRYSDEVTSRKKSKESELSTMRVWLSTPLAKLSLARITSEGIAKLRDEWMKTYAPATVVRRMTPIAHMFVTAKKEWGMTSLVNPFDSVKKPTVSNERTRRVSCRRNCDFGDPIVLAHGDCCRQSPRFKRSRRVQPFVFDENICGSAAG